MLVTDRVYEPFATGPTTFMHGYTFGGHPVSCAVALANLDVMEKDGLLDQVRANEAAFRSTLERLRDLPIVGDVRGAGYFYGIEMVKDKATKRPSTRTSPSGCCVGSCRRPSSTPGSTACRRPWGSGCAAGPAFDLRSATFRRDRADSAQRAHRSLGGALTQTAVCRYVPWVRGPSCRNGRAIRRYVRPSRKSGELSNMSQSQSGDVRPHTRMSRSRQRRAADPVQRWDTGSITILVVF